MGPHIRSLLKNHAHGKATIFYQSPRPEDVAGHDYDVAGLIDADWLVANTPIDDADYFLCGQRPFLRALVAALSLSGVSSYRIHYERSEEHTSELQSLMRISYAVFCFQN